MIRTVEVTAEDLRNRIIPQFWGGKVGYSRIYVSERQHIYGCGSNLWAGGGARASHKMWSFHLSVYGTCLIGALAR